MVCTRGTLVNKLTTSKLTKTSVFANCVDLIFSKKSYVDLTENSEGTKGFIRVSKYFEMLYSGVFTMQFTGLSGQPVLWTFAKPYSFPGTVPVGESFHNVVSSRNLK